MPAVYFVFVVDEAESDLGILDLIQVFVEALDQSFENVSELDMVGARSWLARLTMEDFPF